MIGSAARCEAGLCPAGNLLFNSGYARGSGLALKVRDLALKVFGPKAAPGA